MLKQSWHKCQVANLDGDSPIKTIPIFN